MKRLASLILLTLPGLCAAQTVKLPAEVPAEIGRLTAVKITWDGDDLKYVVPPELDAFREYDPDEKVIRLRVIGYKDGVHRIVAVTCKGGKLSEFAVCVVKVGKAPPGPTPPDPPTPDPPTPPPPTDPLTKALQAAYDKETAPDRAALKDRLAALYKSVGDHAASDLGTQTFGQLLIVLREATASLGLADKQPAVKAAAAEHMKARLPADGLKPLDGDGRVLASETFHALANALGGVK